MNTQQLETFIQVAENLNFARAAEVLNMTQSAVSRQIHALEEELGTKLLLRTTRTVTLTPAGISYLEDAKKVMNTLHIAEAKIQHHTETNIQILTIGCGNEAELDFLCRVLKKCRQRLPEVHPFLKVILHRSILSLFSHGEIDLLFGFREDIPLRSGFVYREIAQIPLCVLISETHPLAERESIGEEELVSENIILCSAVPSRASEVQNQLAVRIPPQSTYISENLQAALSLVRAGYGFTILPEINFDNVEINCVPLQSAEAVSYGVFYRSGALSPLLSEFVELMKETI
ncbi:MAG: LysR family transcriptional regulator [Lachnospiraceae bacterium]|nr:LysR family transcriptional regulator [Lachnospiraceae bacterium]